MQCAFFASSLFYGGKCFGGSSVLPDVSGLHFDWRIVLHCIDTLALLMHSPVYGCLSCCRLFAVVDSVSVNVYMVFGWTCVFIAPG